MKEKHRNKMKMRKTFISFQNKNKCINRTINIENITDNKE